MYFKADGKVGIKKKELIKIVEEIVEAEMSERGTLHIPVASRGTLLVGLCCFSVFSFLFARSPTHQLQKSKHPSFH